MTWSARPNGDAQGGAEIHRMPVRPRSATNGKEARAAHRVLNAVFNVAQFGTGGRRI